MRLFILNTLTIISLLIAQNLLAETTSTYSTQSTTTESVLTTGSWIKVSIPQSGMYQISYTTLRSWGFTPDKVKVYGYGGAMLNEDFSQPSPDDLPQIPVVRCSDRIIFYGEGTITWSASGYDMVHVQNPYTTSSYYFITQNDEADLELATTSNYETVESKTLTTFDDYALHEEELENVGAMGRDLYGENFLYTTIRYFSFDIAGIVGDIDMNINFISHLTTAGTLTIKHNGVSLTDGDGANIAAFGASNDSYYTTARLEEITKSFTPSATDADVITLQFSATSPTLARLDYIKLQFKRELQLYEGLVKFRSLDASKQYNKYQLTKNSYDNIHIWDISTHYEPKSVEYNDMGNYLEFTSNELGVKEYIAFSESVQYSQPTYVSSVSNQNLHGVETPQMIIISPSELYTQAKRLAEFRLENDNISSLIVTPQLIYNEFSSGRPDATAYRRFAKMFYDRETVEGGDSLRYLLLFGDGAYDNRLISSAWSGYNYPFLLTFQGENSLDERYTYVTDDYFGFLDDSSGSNLLSDKPVIGVGRFPVRTLSEATTAVDKIIEYSTNTDYGIWKNDLCFVADDGNSSEHMKLAETLTGIINENHPEFFPHKIYIDAYERVSSATGGTYPDAKSDMMTKIDNGLLLLNYCGHGSTTGWTSEDMLNMQDIQQMYNDRLPLFITATCDFSRFDDLNNSGGEDMFLNSNGGGVALISTTRVVYMDKNATYNTMLIEHLFDRDPTTGQRYRLGDVMRLSKSAVTDYYGSDLNKLNFILLGDPSLQLAYPKQKIKITSINGVEPTDNPDDITIMARQMVTVCGVIVDDEGEIDTEFNGSIEQRLYDSETEITTYGNDDNGSPYTFYSRNSKLYEGKESVTNGEFEFTFKVPKEINYSSDAALLNLYAYDTSRAIEAQGTNQQFVVNGMDTEAEEDLEGPIIEYYYLNREEFGWGDTVNETPVFFASVYDESGINVSGIGLGHDMTIKIDDDPTMEYVINDAFISSEGEFGRGTVMYQLPTMSNGTHTLTFKVWDGEGNSSEATTQFNVEQGLEPDIINLYCKKNPVSEYAEFVVEHDRPDMIMTVKISVFSLWGVELWSSEVIDVSDMWKTDPIIWDLHDNGGKRVSSGLYIYRAEVNTEGSRVATDAKKIVVVTQ